MWTNCPCLLGWCPVWRSHTQTPLPCPFLLFIFNQKKKKLVRQLSEFNLRWDLIFLLLFSRRWSLGDQPIVDSGFILSSPIRPFFLFFILLSSLCPCAATQLWTNMGRRNLNTRHLCGIRSIGGSMDGRDRHDDPPTTTIMREDGVVTLTLTLTKDNAHQATSQAKGYRTLFFFFSSLNHGPMSSTQLYFHTHTRSTLPLYHSTTLRKEIYLCLSALSVCV